MAKKWNVEEARNYVAKVQKGKIPYGLTYCSAIDFLMNHTGSKVEVPPLDEKQGEENVFDSVS